MATRYDKYQAFGSEKIMVAVHSHLKKATEINELINTIETIIAQTCKPNRIYVSISFESAIVVSIFKKKAQQHAELLHPLVEIHMHEEKLAPMKHVQFINEEIKKTPSIEFVIIAGAGDIFDEHRILTFIMSMGDDIDNIGNDIDAIYESDEDFTKPNEKFYHCGKYIFRTCLLDKFFALVEENDANLLLENLHCFLLFSIYFAHMSEICNFIPARQSSIFFDGNRQKTQVLPPAEFNEGIESMRIKLLNMAVLRCPPESGVQVIYDHLGEERDEGKIEEALLYYLGLNRFICKICLISDIKKE